MNVGSALVAVAVVATAAWLWQIESRPSAGDGPAGEYPFVAAATAGMVGALLILSGVFADRGRK
jgi:hypothetical protein